MGIGRMIRLLLAATVAAFAMTVSHGHAAVSVPPGNRHAEQPDIPGASTKRTRAAKTTFEAKYRKVYRLLERDAKLRDKIRETSAQYGIDPMHMVGAIVGEHTYNVDAYDRLQTYYVKAVAYLDTNLTFGFDGESVGDFVARPQFETCGTMQGSYDLWTCRERVWDRTFRGKTVDGKAFPAKRFSATFFQPFYAGQTFGIGQLNPLTALQMSDIVTRFSGLPPLDAGDPHKVYETIMDPDLTLPYMAATIRKSIDAYRDIAGFDISATLYNLGNPDERARALKAENAKRVSEGGEPRLPEENYYGWLVNEKLAELQTLF